MSTTATRSANLAAQITEDITDFTAAELVIILENCDYMRGYPVARAADLLQAIRCERSGRATRAELAALTARGPVAWAEKDLPAFEFTEKMFGRATEYGGGAGNSEEDEAKSFGE